MSTQSTLASVTNTIQAANAPMWQIELENALLDKQGTWSDRLITFAFDKCGVQHIALRVVASCLSSASRSAACCASSQRNIHHASSR